LADQARKKQSRLWLARLAAGDHQAFAEFVEEYKEMVFMCCRTLGLKDDEAEDAASETFLAAYKGLSRYRGRAELGTWLWRIAYNQAVNYLRKNPRQNLLLLEPDEQIADTYDRPPHTELENTEQAQIIWQAVEKLPRLWALAAILFYREDKNIKEIAKIMRVSQNTVKTYLFRGRQKLKELLADALGEDIDVAE
jgi:RNA polymerase sigma factor (sigma-70 family)